MKQGNILAILGFSIVMIKNLLLFVTVSNCIRTAPPKVTVGSIEPDSSVTPTATTPNPNDVEIKVEGVKIPTFDDKGNMIK